MRNNNNVLAFVIGYFVLFSPLFLSWRWPLPASLLWGITGVALTIFIILWEKYYDI